MLRKNIKKGIFFLLWASMIPWIVRQTVQRNRVTIIVYHELSIDKAESHFTWLKSKYNIIELKKLLEAEKKGSAEILPDKALIVTFDDGHHTNYPLTNVFKQHGLKPTIFLCSRIVGTKRHFWWKEISEAKRQKLKKVRDDLRLSFLSKIGYRECREYEIRQALSNDEIWEMKRFVDFQSHTKFHPILTMCFDDKARSEILESKNDLESAFRLKISALAYPNGDYGEREIAFAKAGKYSCAMTLEPGFNSLGCDLYRLRRIVIEEESSNTELAVRVSGVWDFLKNLIRSERLKTELRVW